MKENYLIKKYLLPLCKNFKDSLSLEDDAAILKDFNKENYVISVDNFINGIHCPNNLKTKSIILRAILCATSDLAAMGVTPYCIFLSLSLPKIKGEKIFKDISDGIKEAIKLVDIKIGGGDITSYDGPLAISITAVGRKRPLQKILLRKGGKVGDLIGVTGVIGNAYLGLKILQKKISVIKNEDKKNMVNAFLYPPQLHKFSNQLAKFANCCIDISDGLIEDISKLGALAKSKVKLNSRSIPLSSYASLLLKKKEFLLKDFLIAGDDYQLAFTFNENKTIKINELKEKYNVDVTIIGELVKGKGVFLDNKKISGGYSHL